MMKHINEGHFMTPQPIDVGSQRQLFIDHRFIENSDNVELHVNPPQRRGMVIGEDPRPWEAGYILAAATLIQDGDTLKLWYMTLPECAVSEEGPNWDPINFCYATSTDGINWEKPDLGLFEFEGSTKNNIVSQQFGIVYFDERAPENERYKMAWNRSEAGDKAGLYMLTSPDGLRWTEHPQRVFPFVPDGSNQVMYDPRIGKWVAYVRSWAPQRKVARVEMDDVMQPWPYQELEESSTIWGEGYLPPPSYELPQAMSYDELDPTGPPPVETDLYFSMVSIYPWAEDVYVGFPSPYYYLPPPPNGKFGNDGLLDVQLAVSRDGSHFERPDRSHAYIPLGLSGTPEGGCIYMSQGMARLGDELYQYYGAFEDSHGYDFKDVGVLEGEGGVYLAVQRLDGFMSADAAYTGGWLATPPLDFTGGRLELNIDCAATGHARVELRDANNGPIEGFGVHDCDLIRGNHVHHTVTWKGSSDLSRLSSQPVRLRFTMRNTRLFAFQFDESL
jgi:hypothetical protein